MRTILLIAILPAVLGARALGAEPGGSFPSASGASIIREMNLARQHPDVYAGYIAELRGRVRRRTRESVGAVDEAIRFLRCARPLAPLIFSPGISLAAAEHVADQADGSLGHAGSDRSGPGERMNRHGTWSASWGENIAYGRTTARDVVMALIIDDGVRGRKHRKNIFNPAFNYAGAALGAHARYGTVCSIDFAGGYAEGAGNSRSLVVRN